MKVKSGGMVTLSVAGICDRDSHDSLYQEIGGYKGKTAIDNAQSQEVYWPRNIHVAKLRMEVNLASTVIAELSYLLG